MSLLFRFLDRVPPRSFFLEPVWCVLQPGVVPLYILSLSPVPRPRCPFPIVSSRDPPVPRTGHRRPYNYQGPGVRPSRVYEGSGTPDILPSDRRCPSLPEAQGRLGELSNFMLVGERDRSVDDHPPHFSMGRGGLDPWFGPGFSLSCR